MPNRTTGHSQAAQEAMLDPVGLSASELETVSSWVAERILEDKQSLSIFHKQVMKRLFQNPEARKWLVDALVEEPSFVQTTMRVRNYILRGKLTFSEKVFDLLFEAKSILVASAAFVGILLMGRPEGLSVEGHRALAIFALTAILWVTEGLPLPVTSLLACVMFSLLNVVPTKDAFLGFGNSTMFFLIGALLLGVAIVKANLHKRIALLILTRLGKTPQMMVMGTLLMAVGLAMMMPEHAVGAMLFPVILAIISVAVPDPKRSNFAKVLLMALAYGASVGSIGSLLGGGRNPLAIGLYQEITGETVTFLGWMVAAFPVVLAMTLSALMVLKWMFPLEELDLDPVERHMRLEVKKLGRLRALDKRVLGIFLTAFLLWVSVGTTVGLAVIAIGVAVVLFAARAITWEDAEKGLPWSIIFLYGGAISVGLVLTETGAARFLADHFFKSIENNPYLIVLVLIAISMYLSQVMSDAGALGVVLPIALTVMVAVDFPPIVAMYVVAMGSGMAFMLPTATPNVALIYSSGYISIGDLLKAGLCLTLIAAVVFMTVGWGYWSLIGLF